MFRFANPQYLYLLIIIPLYILLLIYNKKKRISNMKKIGNPDILSELMPEVSTIRPALKSILTTIALVFAILMVAGPQFGSKLQKVKRKGSEIMIALDISNSMLAQDVTPSRLDKSKMLLSRLIDKLRDDKIGLVVFAGEAYTQIPITSDFVSAKMFMNNITPNLISTQGTNISSAIDLCVRSYPPKDKAGRSIILITDGENFEQDAIKSAKAAKEKDITVNVIGMGDKDGSPIPTGKDNSYRKDKDGNVIVTKLNELMCQKIAAAGQGIYVRADNSNSALKIMSKEMDKMSKSDIESNVYSEYDEQFMIFGWFILALLLIDILIIDKKDKIFSNIKLFKE